VQNYQHTFKLPAYFQTTSFPNLGKNITLRYQRVSVFCLLHNMYIFIPKIK
jgi:hypothetical protein